MEETYEVTFGIKKFAYVRVGVGTPLPEGQRRDILPHWEHFVKHFRIKKSDFLTKIAQNRLFFRFSALNKVDFKGFIPDFNLN